MFSSGNIGQNKWKCVSILQVSGISWNQFNHEVKIKTYLPLLPIANPIQFNSIEPLFNKIDLYMYISREPKK